jgi:hypothetical protein
MRIHVLIVALVCSWLSIASRADACSCLPPDEGRSYQNADHVVRVRIQRALARTATTRSFVARLVEDDFKGCLAAGQRVIVETPSSSAACGMTLRVGQEYLLHGRSTGTLLGMPQLQVGLCDLNVVWSELSADHRAFLDRRYVCCGGECACADGSAPVNCFIDPCQVSSCDVEGAVCESNYCGGCNAEWHDPTGALVCAPEDSCDVPGRTYVSRDPEQCATIRFVCAEGQSAFFDDCGCGCVEPTASDCRVAGCSGQLCVGPDDPGITTCEWREEYACYRTATCELQPAGACGWTPTPELTACLQAAP